VTGRTLLLCALVLAAGCAGVSPLSGPASEGSVAVDGVVDGDTIDVARGDGTTDTVRLLGVDTPELRGGTDPAAFEDVPNTTAGRACLRAVAEEASGHLRDLLDGGEVRLTTDDAADRRDRHGRLLAYVSLPDGTDVNRRLVADGYARVYDTEFARSEDYYEAEAAARDDGAGVWRCREPGSAAGTDLVVAEIHADAAGDDDGSLNDEYVVFENGGDAPLDLVGWTVRDQAGHTYAFPEGVVLDPGEAVALHTGSGRDGDGDRYWNRTQAVWNNGGDVVVVADPDGDVVLRVAH